MSDFLKIKQIEDLQAQLDAALNEANNAMGKAQQALDLLTNLPNSGVRVKELYSSFSGLPNQSLIFNVANAIKDTNELQVFVRGVLMEAVTASNDSNMLTINPPYALEPSDTIIVYYTYQPEV
jgi:hypothetical protein